MRLLQFIIKKNIKKSRPNEKGMNAKKNRLIGTKEGIWSCDFTNLGTK